MTNYVKEEEKWTPSDKSLAAQRTLLGYNALVLRTMNLSGEAIQRGESGALIVQELFGVEAKIKKLLHERRVLQHALLYRALQAQELPDKAGQGQVIVQKTSNKATKVTFQLRKTKCNPLSRLKVTFQEKKLI